MTARVLPAAQPGRSRSGLTVADLADLERRKQRGQRVRDYLQHRRELARREKTSERYRVAEGAGQQALDFDRKPEGG